MNNRMLDIRKNFILKIIMIILVLSVIAVFSYKKFFLEPTAYIDYPLIASAGDESRNDKVSAWHDEQIYSVNEQQISLLPLNDENLETTDNDILKENSIAEGHSIVDNAGELANEDAIIDKNIKDQEIQNQQDILPDSKDTISQNITSDDERQAMIQYALSVASGEVTLPYIKDGVFKKNPDAKGMVALTFDDGPYDNISVKYLDVLKEYDVHATFFCIGEYIVKRSQIVERMITDGHEIASHSYRHAKLTELSAAALAEDFTKTIEAGDAVVGISPLLYCRPPYGSFNKTLTTAMETYKQLNVMWSVDPWDWAALNAKKLVSDIIDTAKEGDIILLHENKEITLMALPEIITGLQNKGLSIVTVTELLYQSKLKEASQTE